MSDKRFRIAFSFAGEKRDFVAKVAAILARQFGEAAILYDKYHEAEFARHDLGIHLPRLYGEQSDLIVPVLCRDYDEKRWTGWEWIHIYGLLTKKDGHRVMPCRFEHATVEGLTEVSGFIELDDKSPEATADLILERLALNESKAKDHYLHAESKDKPRTSIPNNLPRLQSFFGREEELAAIREALDPETRTWGALIDGPGGIGKTSLAIRAALDCPVGQFKRIVFVSIKDRELEDDGVRELGNLIVPGFLEMLNEIARELGVEGFAKSAEDQRVRLLLDRLRGSGALLVLDNLESLSKKDRDQLFTFVKRLPEGCKAILTSRRRIGSSADTLILQKLTQEAALETLADLAGHIPLLAKTSEAERITLYKQTGGNPLLLRWVAGQLGRGSCRTFTDALAFLRACPPENDPLEFVFGDLAQEFTGEETQVLCALTYYTTAVEVKHITALVDSPDSEKEALVDDALRGLANRSLVVPDAEERAYALVPMVAEFLRKSRPEVVKETGDRLEKRAYALIIENGYNEHERFPTLEAAWPGIAPALRLFLAGDNERLQTVCDALTHFLEFQGRWDEWLALVEKAKVGAIAAGDHYSAGWRTYNAGYVHQLRGQADALLQCAERASTHWKQSKAGARERAAAIGLRGLSLRMKENYPAAITAYQEALELFRSLGSESKDVALALNYLASAEHLAKDYEAAERDYREALRIAHTVDNVEGIAIYTGNLAELALDRKEWSEAETLARKALTLAKGINRQQLIAHENHRIARALLRQGKTGEALPHAQLAVEILDKLGSHDLAEAEATLKECKGK